MDREGWNAKVKVNDLVKYGRGYIYLFFFLSFTYSYEEKIHKVGKIRENQATKSKIDFIAILCVLYG